MRFRSGTPFSSERRSISASAGSSDSSTATTSFPTSRYGRPFASQNSRIDTRPDAHSVAFSDPGL
ncbi:hypothetical protein D3C87_2024220 [compost metagenome]